MKTEDIIKACNQIANGRFFKISWRTNCQKKMAAASRNQGHIVTKYVTSVCRKGVHYLNIKKVQETKLSNGQFKENPDNGQPEYVAKYREWADDVVPNLIIKHKKTGKHYMVIYTTETKPKSQYYLDDRAISVDKLKASGIMQNSYWTQQANDTAVMTVPVESIIAIGG